MWTGVGRGVTTWMVLDGPSGANSVQVYDTCSRAPRSRSLCPGQDTLVYRVDYWVVFL